MTWYVRGMLDSGAEKVESFRDSDEDLARALYDAMLPPKAIQHTEEN